MNEGVPAHSSRYLFVQLTKVQTVEAAEELHFADQTGDSLIEE